MQPHYKSGKERKSLLTWHGDNESFSSSLPAIYLSRTLHCYPKFWGECSQKRKESGITKARNAQYSWIHFYLLNWKHVIGIISVIWFEQPHRAKASHYFTLFSCWHQPVSVWFCTMETVNFSPIKPLSLSLKLFINFSFYFVLELQTPGVLHSIYLKEQIKRAKAEIFHFQYQALVSEWKILNFRAAW